MRAVARVWMLVLSVGYGAVAHASENCEPRLLSPTDNLILYFETLLDQQLLSFSELESFSKNLDRGVIVNPLIRTASDSWSLVHRANFDRLMVPEVQISRLHDWARDALAARAALEAHRSTNRELTRTAFYEPHFIRIPGGWVTDANGRQRQVCDFEVADILTTQYLWLELMKKNPALNKRGKDHLYFPIENITWWAAVTFTNSFSKREGLRPYYPELFSVEQAADGRVMLYRDIDPTTFGNSPNGTEGTGYRLIKEFEMLLIAQRYLMPRLGQSPDPLQELESYFWTQPGLPQPVGRVKQALIVEGQPLYDFLGNVPTHIDDWQLQNYLPKQPLIAALSDDPKSAYIRVESAVSYRQGATGFQLATPLNGMGFRLARTLPPRTP